MSPLAWVILILVALVLGGTLYLGVRLGARLPGAAPRPTIKFSHAPHPDGEAWRPTAVYLYLGDPDWEDVQRLVHRFGRWWTLLYVGIAFDPQARAQEHWDAEKERALTSATRAIHAEVWPDRYTALAVERATIHDRRPRFNTAMGSTCDAHTKTRPAVVEVPVRIPRGARPARPRRRISA